MNTGLLCFHKTWIFSGRDFCLQPAITNKIILSMYFYCWCWKPRGPYLLTFPMADRKELVTKKPLSLRHLCRVPWTFLKLRLYETFFKRWISKSCRKELFSGIFLSLFCCWSQRQCSHFDEWHQGFIYIHDGNIMPIVSLCINFLWKMLLWEIQFSSPIISLCRKITHQHRGLLYSRLIKSFAFYQRLMKCSQKGSKPVSTCWCNFINLR